MAPTLPLIVFLSLWVFESDASGVDRISSVLLKALDSWDSTCPPHIGSSFESCITLNPDYEDTDICSQTVCAAKALNKQLSHFRQEVRDQIEKSVNSCDNSGPDLEQSTVDCFESKQKLIEKCLANQTSNYCAWKNKTDSKTLYSAEFQELWCSSSDCVLSEVSKCGHRQIIVDYFTKLLNAPDGKNPITCSAGAVVLPKLPAVFVIVLAFGLYIF